MNWLTELITQLFSFIPRMWTVLPDESGVRVTLGKHVKATPPGWYFYWPIIQEIIKITVTPQVVDLRAQSVLTSDGKDMCFGGAIMYKINNAKCAILKIQDYDRSLQALALGIISRYIGSIKSGYKIDVPKIETAILDGVREEAAGWGLKIMKAYITDLGTAKNIRILTDRPIEGVGLYGSAIT